MTAEERRLLMRTPVKLFRWWTGIVSASCIFALTFLSVALLAVIVPFNVIVPLAVAAATFASVSSYAWIQRKARKNLRLQVALASRDLAAGDVRSEIYNITDAVAVEESEDEGLSYYLLLDDGRTLFLSGQYLYEPVENGFPWDSFEIVRVASGQWVLRIVPIGLPLAPSFTRKPFSVSEWRSGAIPADGAIEHRSFDALKVPAGQPAT